MRPTRTESCERAINNGIMGVIHYFPEGSQTGGDTRALPGIWENRENFLAKAEALRAASVAIIANPPETYAEFQAAFDEVNQYCGNGHEIHRHPED